MYLPILLTCSLVLCFVLGYSEAETESHCVKPGAPLHGKVILIRNAIRVGNIAVYSCDRGYILHGSAISKCLSTTEWSAATPRCLMNSCDDPGDVSHARRNGSMFTVASSVTYVCDTGYVLEGSPQLLCEDNGKWNVDLPSCKKIPCEHPEAPLYGRVDLSSAKITIGSIATYSCDKEYKLHGSSISECFIGGWTYPPPACSKDCAIPEVQNGYFIYSSFFQRHDLQERLGNILRRGQELYVGCSPPYVFQGRNDADRVKVQCERGKWIPQPMCLLPPNNVVTTNEPVGILQTVTEVKNPPTITMILPNARVSKEKEVVTAAPHGSITVSSDRSVSCTLESLMRVLPNEVVPVAEDVKGPVVAQGDILKLECSQDGLRLLGVPNVTCSESGTWIVDKVSCVRWCGPIHKSDESKLIVEPEKDFYRFGEDVIIYCPPGYTLSSEVEMLMCLSHGWSERDIPSCLST